MNYTIEFDEPQTIAAAVVALQWLSFPIDRLVLKYTEKEGGLNRED